MKEEEGKIRNEKLGMRNYYLLLIRIWEEV